MENKKINFKLTDLLGFKRFVLVDVLTVIYWIVLVLIILSGFTVMARAGFFTGLVSTLVSFVFVRIIFEVIAVFFSINNNTAKLVSLLGGDADELGASMDVSAKDTINTVQEKAEDLKNKAESAFNSASTAASNAINKAKHKSSDVADRAQSSASDTLDQAKETTSNAANAAKEAAGNVSEKASDIVDSAKDAITDTAQDVKNAVKK